MPDFGVFTTYVRAIFIALFPVISSGEWTKWEAADQQALNKFMHLLGNVFNDKLRRAYDQTIWDGHKTGAVDKGLAPVRKETVRKDAAGKEAPSVDSIFDELAGTTTSAEPVTVTLDEV